jgi:EPS-associated MarR family transcriptional regulator
MNQGQLATEAHYRVLKALEANPNLSQRQLASLLGISVGKANYCINALIEKGWVKARNFRSSKNKLGYAYVLTPQGIRRRTQLAMRFLEIKRGEFEALQREIKMLDAEVKNLSGDRSENTKP